MGRATSGNGVAAVGGWRQWAAVGGAAQGFVGRDDETSLPKTQLMLGFASSVFKGALEVDADCRELKVRTRLRTSLARPRHAGPTGHGAAVWEEALTQGAQGMRGQRGMGH